MMQKYRWELILILMTLLALGFVLGDWRSPLRPIVTFSFILICPGMAFVRLIGIENKWAEMTIAIALSLALGQLVSMIILYVGLWSVQANILALGIVSLVGVALQFRNPLTELLGNAAR